MLTTELGRGWDNSYYLVPKAIILDTRKNESQM